MVIFFHNRLTEKIIDIIEIESKITEWCPMLPTIVIDRHDDRPLIAINTRDMPVHKRYTNVQNKWACLNKWLGQPRPYNIIYR